MNLERLGVAGAVAIASTTAVVAIVTLSGPAHAGGAPPLLPDLVTLALDDEDLVMVTEAEKTMLRLTNEVANRGLGPLEVTPSAGSQNCDGDGDPFNDRDASQRVYADSNATGVFERGADAAGPERPFGCVRYHPEHDHWHVLGFATYRLRSEQTGRVVATTRKLGFCLGDNRFGYADPGASQTPVYPVGASQSTGCTASTIQGVSVGWVDVYLFDVPGQALRVNGLPRGRYCLTSRADPGNLLDEANETNNVRRTRIALDPRRNAVRKLTSACRR